MSRKALLKTFPMMHDFPHTPISHTYQGYFLNLEDVDRRYVTRHRKQNIKQANLTRDKAQELIYCVL